MQEAPRHIIEENLVSVRRFIEEVLAGGNPNSFDELVAHDIRVTTVLKPTGVIEGKGEYIRVLGQTVSGTFADREVVIEDIAPLIDGRIMARVTAKATHIGTVFGIPPTYRRITAHELLLIRLRDGRIIELLAASLNPLEFEMLFAPAISAMLFGQEPMEGERSVGTPQP